MQGCTYVKNAFHERVGFELALVFCDSQEFGTSNDMLYLCLGLGNLSIDFFLLDRKYLPLSFIGRVHEGCSFPVHIHDSLCLDAIYAGQGKKISYSDE